MKMEEFVIWEEIDMLWTLSHPNVIKLHETFEDAGNLFMVLDHCSGGELLDFLAECGGVAEESAARILKQISLAIQYLHGIGICHRDVQPESFLVEDANVPLPEATIKLIGFTTAKRFGPDYEMLTKICKCHYAAPEILSRKETPYTEKIDIWSLGVCFFTILGGSPPFQGRSDIDTLKKIKKGEFQFEPQVMWTNISKGAKDLITGMLVLKAQDRLSANDVVGNLWLSDKNRRSSRARGHMSQDQLNNLRSFNAQSRVTKAVLQLSAHQVSPASVKELRGVFKKLSDAEGNVELSIIRDKIRKMPSMTESMDEVMRCLWKLEKGTGMVRFNEFVEAMIKRHEQLEKDAVRAVFDVFDFDGGGSIDLEEIEKAMDLGEDRTSWKHNMEVIFGIPADQIRDALSSKLGKDELVQFEEFYQIVKVCASEAS